MSDQPHAVSIYDESEELTTIRTGDGRAYDIVYDPASGDWLIGSSDDERVQGGWFLTEDGAIQYILMLLGVIEEASYTRAPDRC